MSFTAPTESNATTIGHAEGGGEREDVDGLNPVYSPQIPEMQELWTAEGMTGRSSPRREGEFADGNDAWNWLLNIEENYRATIANVAMEVQNRIYLDDNTTSENEDHDDEKHFRCDPEPEEPTPARMTSSETWFSACYTDYRESYSSSESEGDDDDCRYDADSEGGTEDEEMTSAGLTCSACRRDVCECTMSLLDEMATTSLWEDADAHSSEKE